MSVDAPRPLRLCKRWREPPPLPAPPEGVVVRRLAAGDRQAIGRVFWLAFRGSVADAYPSRAEAERDADETLAGRWGPLIGDASLIALVGAELVAAVIVVRDTACAGIPLLAYAATVPGYQRRGIATYLIAAAETALAACGRQELHLVVLETNPARRLYDKLGFESAE